jgi:hypothetical protein
MYFIADDHDPRILFPVFDGPSLLKFIAFPAYSPNAADVFLTHDFHPSTDFQKRVPEILLSL